VSKKNKPEIDQLRAEGAVAARDGKFRKSPYHYEPARREWYTGFDREVGLMKAEREVKLNAFTKRVMLRIRQKVEDKA
jgi:hypothetical protein